MKSHMVKTIVCTCFLCICSMPVKRTLVASEITPERIEISSYSEKGGSPLDPISCMPTAIPAFSKLPEYSKELNAALNIIFNDTNIKEDCLIYILDSYTSKAAVEMIEAAEEGLLPSRSDVSFRFIHAKDDEWAEAIKMHLTNSVCRGDIRWDRIEDRGSFLSYSKPFMTTVKFKCGTVSVEINTTRNSTDDSRSTTHLILESKDKTADFFVFDHEPIKKCLCFQYGDEVWLEFVGSTGYNHFSNIEEDDPFNGEYRYDYFNGLTYIGTFDRKGSIKRNQGNIDNSIIPGVIKLSERSNPFNDRYAASHLSFTEFYILAFPASAYTFTRQQFPEKR